MFIKEDDIGDDEKEKEEENMGSIMRKGRFFSSAINASHSHARALLNFN